MSTITALVRERYAEAATRAAAGGAASCGCGTATDGDCDPITSNLYDAAQAGALPEAALRASLGCGNPTALANAATAGISNVEFLKGQIEAIPLPDATADVIISNCVINLSADKAQVLREAFRVLKPGGRFAVSDVVLRGEVPEDLRKSVDLWVGCVAGALGEGDYRSLLGAAGFSDITLEITREYTIDGVTAASAFVRATKPASARPAEASREGGCCGPTCCA